MAGIFNEDESTDDEFFVNLHLAEKLRINRGENSKFGDDKKFENSKDYKQYCNMRRKKFAQEGQSSSSSSVEVPNENPGSGFASSDSYHNKKRQNGDKNTEQLANPKRTCLSDRFHRSPDWRDLKKKTNIHEPQPEKSIYPESLYLQSGPSSDIFSDLKHEGHRNNLADAEDSDFEAPLRINGNSKTDSQSSKSKVQTSATNKVPVQCFESKPSTSYFRILDSGSEDESKSVMQNGALKGGRQDSATDNSYYKKLFSGRKINKKLLDSDESEDDINPMVKYRSKPLLFSSSDSEDFKQNSSKSKHNSASTKGLATNSHSYSNGFEESDVLQPKHLKSFRSLQKFSKKPFGSSNRTDNCDGCDGQFLSSDFSRKNVPHRPGKSRRSPRMHNMQSNLATSSFNSSNNLGLPVRGRRINASERGARRSGSPHHRSHRSQIKPDDSKCRGRSASTSRRQKSKPDYVVRYSDVFDAEESENEFFTANSYSDTETSTESLGGLTIETNFANHNGSVSCTIKSDDRLFADASSDDEISVVFACGPLGRNNESRRGTSRTLGRRHIRGTPYRQLQNTREIVSLSPDPVEQVRQMEEDERMAMMLQAQFDAEVDHDYTPHVSQHSVIASADSDDDIIDPVGDSDSDDSPPPDQSIIPYFFSTLQRRGHGMNRFTSNRTGQSPLIFGSRRPDNRRRRTLYRASSRERIAENQINFGLFEFGLPGLGASFLDDYEVLLSLDLDDDAAPRGLTKGEINRLPTRKYIHPNSVSSSSSAEVTHKRTELNKECQVCLTDYEMGDVLRILPCFHEFHTPCIDPWLTINQTCPVCRVTVDLDG